MTKSIRPMTSAKVSGSTITSGVHCLVHDVVIRSLTLLFGRLFIGGLSCCWPILLFTSLKILALPFCSDFGHVRGIVKGVIYCCADAPARCCPVGAGQLGSVFARARSFGANCTFFSNKDVVYE